MASELFVDNITGKTGTSGGAPITLSGDTATLGSGATIGSAVTGTLGSGVNFPAGHIIQVTTGSVIGQSESSATNTTFATTPETIINNYQTEIQVKNSGSKIIIFMSIVLRGSRVGPGDAYGTIGFTHSATSGDSKSPSDYTNVVTGGSDENENSLYINRRNVSSSHINDNTGFASTGTMVFVHTHGQSVDRYLYYTAMTRTSYSNASAIYSSFLRNSSAFIVLMELVQ